MAGRKDPIFLARESYRRRRMADAARLIPVLALILLLLPGLWTTTAGSMIYIFTVWGCLIVVIGFLSSRLRDDAAPEDGGEAPSGNLNQGVDG